MSEFRFIHCSDLHLDTPFSGLAKVRPELKEKLRHATFQAFQNIIDLALREQVDAVIVAGDVYDAEDKSLQAQLKFRNALTKLAEAGIPAFVAHGNHDPLNSRSASLQYPENVTIFPGDRVERCEVAREGKPTAHVYGIGFPERQVTENLALRFDKKHASGFAVGVLHTNVGGNSSHENYAPCQLKQLLGKGMDYWALGHVHAHQILREHDPAVVYSGNSQARSFKEQGRKGCCLVTLREQAPPQVRFVATDVIRYVSQDMDITHCSSLDDVLRSIRSKSKEISSDMDGRDVLIRFKLTGRSMLHAELHRGGALDELQEDIHDQFSARSPGVWVDLGLDTRGLYDIDSRRQGNDFIADILSLYDEAENGALLDDIKDTLKPLFEEWPGGRYLDDLTPEELMRLVQEARELTLDQLMEDD
ncbi:MAG: exonuclease SbcCD subunit D [Nitrospinales bacterium]